jgi:hypothetical protein
MPIDLLAQKDEKPRDLLSAPSTANVQKKGLAAIPGFVAEQWGKFIGETPERATTFTDAAIDAVPVAGPIVSSALNEGGAHLRSIVHGQPVDQSRQEIDERGRQMGEKHGEARAAGQLTGTIAPLMALGSTQLGGKVLGETGSLVSRALLGGISGGAIAGADTALRGGGVDDVLFNSALGAGGGVAFPIASAGARKVAQALKGTKPSKSASIVNRALSDDLIEPDGIQRQLQALGPDATLADLGPNLQRQAAAIAATPGEGQRTIRQALTNRSKASPSRIVNELNDTLGPVISPSQLSDDIKRAQEALSPQYEAALQGARRIDTQPIADTLDSLVVNLRGDAQRTAKKLRDMLNVVGTDQLDPNPRTIFEVRKAIDGLFDGVTDGNVRRVLGDTRKQVDDLLTQSVTGIKKVDAQFEELAKQKAGFERGRSVLGGGKTSPHPTELADEFAAASPGTQMRMSQGAREQIERIVGTNANDTAALNRLIKSDGDWNRARLTTLFGEEKANKIFDIVDRERRFAATANTVLGNSETAARQAAQAEINPQGFNPRGTSITDLLLKPVEIASRARTKARSSQLNREIAELLMGNNVSPEFLNQLATVRQPAGRELVTPAALPLAIDRVLTER